VGQGLEVCNINACANLCPRTIDSASLATLAKVRKMSEEERRINLDPTKKTYGNELSQLVQKQAGKIAEISPTFQNEGKHSLRDIHIL